MSNKVQWDFMNPSLALGVYQGAKIKVLRNKDGKGFDVWSQAASPYSFLNFVQNLDVDCIENAISAVDLDKAVSKASRFR